MILTWHGHSVVSITTIQGINLIIDPFITHNPVNSLTLTDIDVDYILITHGHNDHVGDAVAISKQCNAPIIAMVELADYLETQGVTTIPMNLGGKLSGDFGTIKFTPALHSSTYTVDNTLIPCGLAAGFIIDDGSTKVYHAGDTALFSDLQLIGPVDIAFLPIGDTYTMGIDDAIKAADLIQAGTVIPIHYNTFDEIKQNPYHFINLLPQNNGFVPDKDRSFNESCIYL